MTINELPDFLTVEEAAAVLRISRTSAYLLAQRWRATAGREGMPCRQFGRVVGVPRQALIDLTQATG